MSYYGVHGVRFAGDEAEEVQLYQLIPSPAGGLSANPITSELVHRNVVVDVIGADDTVFLLKARDGDGLLVPTKTKLRVKAIGPEEYLQAVDAEGFDCDALRDQPEV